MYWFIGSIIGALVGYSLSGVTFDDIHNAEVFALQFSGRGDQFMKAFGGDSSSDLKAKLAMYLLGSGVLGMFVGGFAKSTMQKIKDAKRKCPNCAESVKKDAKVCRYCGHTL